MVNKVILVGNLGRDAELRYTPGGAPVSTFNLACTEKWRDKGGQLQERTEWVRVVLWGKAAESLNEYLFKGKQVYVEGKLQTRKWQARDGSDRYTTEVRADSIKLLGGGKGNGGRRQQSASQAPAAAPIDPGGFDEENGVGELGGESEPITDGGSIPGSEWADDIPF
jgi:single-strand DNA-binding protein